MRGRTAVRVLRRLGLVHPHKTLKDISWSKNITCPNKSWREFCQYVMMINYITGNVPDEGVFVPELNTMWGGTLTINLEEVRGEG
ncbi:MAG: hypothetical protein ACTSPB_00585 [Candidatus Thorarchaeota archaeon]